MNKQRKQIWDKTGGKCYYCGCDLPDRWHQDHLEPLRRNPIASRGRNGKLLSVKYKNDVCEHPDRDTVDNLVPSCPRCNLRKDTFDVEQFRQEIAAQVERLMNHSNQFRLALDYGLIEITGKGVEFYFEQSKNDSPEGITLKGTERCYSHIIDDGVEL